ncbi:MAG: T9SS type A sorting domain-containing protein [Chitinophagaceae bacterium]|nr:MAG: T9SS type A sorting domain-containing protein [Chitinophagaceae bacterium]
MKKRSLAYSLVLLFLFETATAQQFEWASSGDNLNGGMRASVLDAAGNMIVAGVANMPMYYSGGQQLYSSSGDSKTIGVGDFMFLASYSPDGKINWVREVQGADDPVGMGIDTDGNIVVLASNERNPSFREIDVRVELGRYFILHISPEGRVKKVVADTLGLLRDPMRFVVTREGDYLVTQSEYRLMDSGKGYNEEVGFFGLYKLNKDFKTVWKQEVRRFGHHGYYTQGVLIDEGTNGDVYAVVSVAEGAGFGNKKFTPPVVDSVGQYNPAYEAYLACYNKEGKLKWLRASGGKSIFSSIKATASGVYIGGHVHNNQNFFGKKIVTTGRKGMVLAAFDLKGKLKWAETTTAHTIRALATDQNENIYAIVESKISYPDKQVFYTDTLRNVYESLLLASFDAKGKYRWIKHTKLPMSTNQTPNLLTDNCGDIYVSGELWWVMKAEMKWFDAALVKGYGYGPMPFAGKIKNTLPSFVKNEPAKCIISPSPWTIMNYPNPFTGSTTVQYKVTYDDKNVSLLLYDISGKLNRIVFSKKQHKKGTYTLTLSASGLASGMYVLVLRGTEAVATEQIVVSR